MYASVVELEEFLGRDFHPSEYPAAERALSVASDAVDAACGRTFALAVDHEIEVVAPLGADLLLGGGPITELSEITIVEPDGALRSVGLPQVLSFADGTVRLLSGRSWGGPDARVRVKYSHGWANPPAVIKDVALGAAARQIANPENLQQESLGGYTKTYGVFGGRTIEPRGVDLTDAEKQRLEDAGYRITSGSAPIAGRR